MPMSTPAKVTIGVLAGAATLTGVGVAVARARSSTPKGGASGGGMRRDDGTRPADRAVVQLEEDALFDIAPGEMGFPISVGDRNDIVLSKDLLAELAAGRRIEEVKVAKVVGGEAIESKTWSVSTDSFDLRHGDVAVEFDASAGRLSFIADRAGVYVLLLRDQEGDEIADDFAFLATSKAAA